MRRLWLLYVAALAAPALVLYGRWAAACVVGAGICLMIWGQRLVYRRASSTGWVYLLSAPDGLYKIGFTDRNPQARFEEIQAEAKPIKLKLEMAGRGGRQLEKALHAKYRGRYASENSLPNSTEWFRLSKLEVREVRWILAAGTTWRPDGVRVEAARDA